MTFPTPHTLHVRHRIVGGEDAHGNPTAGWSEPQPWLVHGIAPGANEEPGLKGRDLSEVAWTVYAPPVDPPHEGDRVIVDGDEFEVDGRPSDWSRGPWVFTAAGLSVRLKRIEG